MDASSKEVMFRKKLNYKNTLRYLLKNKKQEAFEIKDVSGFENEYLKLKQEISYLENEINTL